MNSWFATGDNVVSEWLVRMRANPPVEGFYSLNFSFMIRLDWLFFILKWLKDGTSSVALSVGMY